MFSAGEAAQQLGVHVSTIQRWDRQGKIRVVRTAGGKRRIPESEIQRLLGSEAPSRPQAPVIYGRVSSHEQKARGDLTRQVGRFNRYFYKYTPPCSLEEIEADLRQIEREIAEMLAEVTE